MKQLYLKAALTIFSCIVLSFVLSFGVMLSQNKKKEQLLFHHFFGLGMLPLQRQLQQKSIDEAKAWIERNRPLLSVPLQLKHIPSQKRTHLASLSMNKVRDVLFFQDYRNFTFYLPLRKAHFMIVGPIQLPPARSMLAFHLSILAIIILLLTAVLILPIARRLRTLEQATHALSQEQWDTQVPVGSNDAFGQLARSFNQMAARIQQLFQDREELLQAVSHELSTPLARMQLSLELLSSAKDQQATDRHMHSLSEDLNELEDINAELVEWLEADAPTIQQETHDLTPTLAQLIEHIDEETDDGICFQFEHHGSLQAHVSLRQFQRAIENLLRNAARHATSRIVVKATQETSHVRIEICDDGEGVPEARREQIFAPFVSFSKDKDGCRSGTGLGLSIVQRILHRHKGKVSIQQAPGGGANFVTLWPMTSDLPIPEPKESVV